jgi:hypothetical protein
VAESLNDDFIVTDIVVDEVGIGRQNDATHAGNAGLSADKTLLLKSAAIAVNRASTFAAPSGVVLRYIQAPCRSVGARAFDSAASPAIFSEDRLDFGGGRKLAAAHLRLGFEHSSSGVSIRIGSASPAYASNMRAASSCISSGSARIF